MDSVLKYILRAELHNRVDDEKPKSFLFEREFRLKYIGASEPRASSSGQKFSIYSDFRESSAYIYEIEVINKEFLLSDKYEKSAEFMRRVNYTYDWIQLQVNLRGNVVSILNEEELRDKWIRIKKSLLSDYTGDVVDAYLDELDARIADSKMLYSDIHRYFNFGLIFPSIPYKHAEDWERSRIIEFSEYEEEKFEEQIVFKNTENEERIYDIHICPIEDTETQLEQYEGNIVIPNNDIYPLSALVEVVFRNDGIANQWYFKLERIE